MMLFLSIGSLFVYTQFQGRNRGGRGEKQDAEQEEENEQDQKRVMIDSRPAFFRD